MSFKITYRRLFEIRILQEFFLSPEEDKYFFSLNDAERQRILEEKTRFGLYNSQNQIEIVPTESCLRKLRNARMKFSSNALGAFIGVEVEETSGGFTPKIEVPVDLNLSFYLQIKSPLFWTMSQLNFSPEVPFRYYLTNRDPDTVKSFPSLSEPVAPFQNNKEYEMGELAHLNGKVQYAELGTTNSNDFKELNIEGYVNEADRFLIGGNFTYTFKDPVGITSVSFKLMDGADEVKGLTFNNITQPALPFQLDFSTVPDSTDPSIILPISEGRYTLKIEADNGFTEERNIYKHDTWYRKDNFGILDIHLETGNADFNLLTGNLVKDPLPVFEIRVKNRLVHFRYNKRTPFTADELSGTNSFLNPIPLVDPVQLTSKDPRNLLAGPTYFGSPVVPLPSPDLNFISIEDNKTYTEIYISGINPLIKDS